MSPKTLASQIEDFYNANFSHLSPKKQFHFASRLYLSTGKPAYRQKLEKLQEKWLGRNKRETEEILREVLNEPAKSGTGKKAALRQQYLQKYPLIKDCNRFLFKILFAKTIYHKDIGPLAWKVESIKKIIKIANQLQGDNEAISILSTVAVNFLYLAAALLPGQVTEPDPRAFLKIMQNERGTSLPHLQLQIYLLTHSIIGESLFYSRPITRHEEAYREMIRVLNWLIGQNFKKVSLDCKFEYLVCARLCRMPAQNEGKILEEADKSLSPDGHYLVDTLNEHAANARNKSLSASEHRNTLLLVSQLGQWK